MCRVSHQKEKAWHLVSRNGAARATLTRWLKRVAARVTQWRALDQHYAVGEFSLQLLGWDRPRRFVVIREQLRAVGATLGKRQEHVSEEVKEISWKAQQRLHERYRKLLAKGKNKGVAVTAVGLTQGGTLEVN